MGIWEPKPPGTLWATPGLLRDCFTFTVKIIIIIIIIIIIERILLKYVLNKQSERLDLILLARRWIQWRDFISR